MRSRTLLAILSPLLPVGAALGLSVLDADARADGELAALLRAEARPGDVVVVSPDWDLDRLRAFEGVGLPILAARPDRVAQSLERASRLWIAYAAWQLAPPLAPLSAGWRVERRHVGRLAVDVA